MSEKKNFKSNKTYNTILSRRGFSISKDEFTDKQLKSIKKDLTVTPISHINYGPSAPSFKIYKDYGLVVAKPSRKGKRGFDLIRPRPNFHCLFRASLSFLSSSCWKNTLQ